MVDLTGTAVVKLSRGVMIRSFSDEGLMTRTGTDVVHALNPSAAFTIGLVDGVRSVNEICEAIAGSVDATPDVIQPDVADLFTRLLELGFLEQS